jgi:hypothetical protein
LRDAKVPADPNAPAEMRPLLAFVPASLIIEAGSPLAIVRGSSPA